MPVCSRLLSTFSSIRLNVIGFTLRSLIHLDLSFVYGNMLLGPNVFLRKELEKVQSQALVVRWKAYNRLVYLTMGKNLYTLPEPRHSDPLTVDITWSPSSSDSACC